MNVNRTLAIEFFIAIGINSWGAIKQGYAPWPPTIIASCIAMAILSLTSAIDERLAVWLGAGFLLASTMAVAQQAGGSSTSTTGQAAAKWSGTFGAVPPDGNYDVLKVGGAAANSAGNLSGGQGKHTNGGGQGGQG